MMWEASLDYVLERLTESIKEKQYYVAWRYAWHLGYMLCLICKSKEQSFTDS